MSVNVDQTTFTVIASLDSNEVSLVEERPTISVVNGGEEVVITDMRGPPGANGSDGEDGATPQLRSSGGYIQTSTNGINWTNLVALSALTGAKGDKGEAGNTPDLRLSGDYIQFSLDDGATWANLIQLAEIQGPRGAQGPDGHTPQIRIADGYIQVRYFVEDEEIEYEWVNLIALADLKGVKGDKGDRGDDAVIPANVVTTDGASFTGSVTSGGSFSAAGLLYSGSSGNFGEVQLVASDIANAQSFSMRQGIIGQSNGGWSLRDLTNGADRIEVQPSGNVNIPGALSQAGNQVWHAGNFVPGDYAPLSGAAFTGALGSPAYYTGDTNAVFAFNGGNPVLGFDSGDYLDYQRGSNQFRWVIGNTQVASLNAGGLTLGGAATIQGKTNLAASTSSGASLNVPTGTAPSSPVEGDIWRDSTGLYLRKSGATRSILTNDAATMAGRFVTSASTTGGAGLNIPHGTAPTTPSNGDVWTTSAGVFARVNGVTKQIDGATSNFTSKVNFAAPTTSAASINLGVSSNTPSAPINGDVWMDDFGLNYMVYDTVYQVPISAAVPYLSNTWTNANTYNGPSGRIVLAGVSGGKGRLNIGSATAGPALPDAGDIWAQSNVLKYRKGSTTVDILTSDLAIGGLKTGTLNTAWNPTNTLVYSFGINKRIEIDASGTSSMAGYNYVFTSDDTGVTDGDSFEIVFRNLQNAVSMRVNGAAYIAKSTTGNGTVRAVYVTDHWVYQWMAAPPTS
ncbi:hypothetical protein P6144_00335 [Sphingomonas sp. HITSZ_GF]|uniref:hypothetical protein n=1 Tax=Sphingomonas sp. HITSZ_GF TaxID=3037247 RepID=UPI00240D47D6|nr:hypothetical protein [Sphingomonas sp. HITSZ_GF]MDG2532083.1 hypothetical protein [Sphingomonas sp. HITSZ_GF]